MDLSHSLTIDTDLNKCISSSILSYLKKKIIVLNSKLLLCYMSAITFSSIKHDAIRKIKTM